MTESKLGVGILGAANIANKTIRAIGMTDSLQVVAVGSRDQSKAEALLQHWGVGPPQATAYSSYDAVLSDPSVDIVYIPLPSALHVPWVQKAAAAGKHIMLEKPIAINDTDLAAIYAACAEHAVRMIDGTMWVHSPRTRAMEKNIFIDKSLGEVKEVIAAFTFAADESFWGGNVRSKKDLDPQGALGDLGWYCCRVILWAFQYETPLSVTAHPGALFTEEGVPIYIAATLLFSNNRRAVFTCSFDRALTQKVDICGTLGTISLDDFVIPCAEDQVKYTITSKNGLKFWDTYDGTEKDTVVVYTPKPQEVVMWDTFAAEVQKSKAGHVVEDSPWAGQAQLTQRCLNAVLKSIDNSNQPVEL